MGEDVGCKLGSSTAASMQKDDCVRVWVAWLSIDNVERWEWHISCRLEVLNSLSNWSSEAQDFLDLIYFNVYTHSHALLSKIRHLHSSLSCPCMPIRPNTKNSPSPLH